MTGLRPLGPGDDHAEHDVHRGAGGGRRVALDHPVLDCVTLGERLLAEGARVKIAESWVGDTGAVEPTSVQLRFVVEVLVSVATCDENQHGKYQAHVSHAGISARNPRTGDVVNRRTPSDCDSANDLEDNRVAT